MCKNKMSALVLFLVGIFSHCSVSAAVVEDFSTSADAALLRYADQVRTISNGKLILESRNYNSSDSTVYPRSHLRLRDTSISAIQATVVIKDVAGASSDNVAFFSIAGGFYNALVNPEDDLTGRVWAEARIGDRGNGLEAWVAVSQSTNSDFTGFDLIAEEVLLAPGSISIDTEYTVKLAYDGNNSFQVSVNDVSTTVVGPQFGSDVQLSKRVRTGLDLGPSDDSLTLNATSISAEVDDVFINSKSTVFENFSNTELDTVKWLDSLGSSKVVDGKMALSLESEGVLTQYAVYLTKNTNDVSGRIAILSGASVSEGSEVLVALQGFVYNDTYDTAAGDLYNGRQGDHYVRLGIYYNEDRLKAKVGLSRTSDSESSVSTSVFHEDFATPIEFDKEYVVSIKLVDKKILFKLDDETLTYNIETNVYPPSPDKMRFAVRVQEGAGSVSATVDDISYIPLSEEGNGNSGGSSSSEDGSGSSAGGGSLSPLMLLLSVLILLGYFVRRNNGALR